MQTPRSAVESSIRSEPSPSTWSEEPLRRWRNILACLGLGAIAAFVIALVVLHVSAGQQPPSHMSEFANSRFGLLWALAVYTCIVGCAMVAWALKPCLSNCPSKWIGMAMLWLAGIAALLLATFPTDDTYVQTFSGRVHNEAALTTFALLGAAMVVLAPAFRDSPSLGRFARVSVLLGVLVTASWVTYLVTTLRQIEVYAPAQRILVALITTWFVLLALRLRSAAAARPRRNLRSIVLVASTQTPVPAPVRRPTRARRGKAGKPRSARSSKRGARPAKARPRVSLASLGRTPRSAAKRISPHA